MEFHTDEAATVKLSGGMKAGKKGFALPNKSRQVPADTPTRLAFKLSDKAKKAVKKAKKATFTVRAVTSDAAGNKGSGGAKRKYKR